MASIKDTFMGMKTGLRKFRHEFGAEFLERVKARTPVVSGRLQAGWDYKLQSYDVVIYNKVHYAGFVEYGTPKMEPRGMLRVTIMEVEQIAEVAAEKAGLKQ